MSESSTVALHNSDVLIIGYAACCLALACGKELNAPRYFTQLLEFKDVTAPPGPIIYWDQGHEHVFGDPTGMPGLTITAIAFGLRSLHQ